MREAVYAGFLLVLLAFPARASAQTDYYNTDAGRPVVIEDAHPTERYAFELQLAPLRLERSGSGEYTWSLEPELAYGILPRTHIEVGFPLVYRDASVSGPSRTGLGGIEVSALHNLNVETETLPAFGVAADVLMPVGEFAPPRVYPSLKAIATRTFSFMRAHANGQFTLGESPVDGEEAELEDVSRWLAGVAIDRTFPLRALLVIADVYVREPLHGSSSLQWNAGAGFRYQISPHLNIDAGIGRSFSGEDQAWSFTVGSAYALGIRSLMPARSDAASNSTRRAPAGGLQ